MTANNISNKQGNTKLRDRRHGSKLGHWATLNPGLSATTIQSYDEMEHNPWTGNSDESREDRFRVHFFAHIYF